MPTPKLGDAWARRFGPPVPLPDGGGEIETLDQARTFIISLPEAVHRTAPWQTAIEALLLVAEHKGPTMFARIALMRALYPEDEPVYDTSRKDPVWRSRRRLARDL